MPRFLHISGVYTTDATGVLQKKHVFSREEQEALIHAKAIGNDAAIAKIAGHGYDPTHDELRKLLSEVDTTSLREANLLLTKQSIRESVKPDMLIINTSHAIEELDKVCNTLAKRLREWYALYNPELEHAYKDHQAFVEAVLTSTAQRSDGTMGGEIGEVDYEIILSEASKVRALYVQRDALISYLERIMQQQTPNIMRVATPTIGAKLLALAGSLERLSRMPSSTVQLLGAETALFRHLRNPRAKPPKHGIIFNHMLLQRTQRQNRGRVARTLADKISIAAKVDYFKGEFVGDTLYAEVEKRAKE